MSPAPARDAAAPGATAGVVAPPPLLYGGTLVLGLAADALLGLRGIGLPNALRWGLVACLVLVTAPIVVSAFLAFRRAGTEVLPTRPTTALATDGAYRWTRNPMYLSLSLLYAAAALAADAPLALALLVPLLVVVRYGVIAREERYLAARFGKAYRDYTRRTRRWL